MASKRNNVSASSATFRFIHLQSTVIFLETTSTPRHRYTKNFSSSGKLLTRRTFKHSRVVRSSLTPCYAPSITKRSRRATECRSLFVESHPRVETISRRPSITLDVTRSGRCLYISSALVICFVVHACYYRLAVSFSPPPLFVVRVSCSFGRDEWRTVFSSCFTTEFHRLFSRAIETGETRGCRSCLIVRGNTREADTVKTNVQNVGVRSKNWSHHPHHGRGRSKVSQPLVAGRPCDIFFRDSVNAPMKTGLLINRRSGYLS